jgi:hypothetical protein
VCDIQRAEELLASLGDQQGFLVRAHVDSAYDGQRFFAEFDLVF